MAYYQEHGQNLSRTVKALGYPNRALLFEWLKEDTGRATRSCRSGSAVVKLPQIKKEQAVIDLCVRDHSAECIASKYGVSRGSLYKWKNEMLGKECVPEMPEKSVTQPAGTEHTVEELRSEVAIREAKVSDLQSSIGSNPGRIGDRSDCQQVRHQPEYAPQLEEGV